MVKHSAYFWHFVRYLWHFARYLWHFVRYLWHFVRYLWHFVQCHVLRPPWAKRWIGAPHWVHGWPARS